MNKPTKHKKRSYTARKILGAGILATSLIGGSAMAERAPLKLGMFVPPTAPGVGEKPIKLGMPMPTTKPHNHRPFLTGIIVPRKPSNQHPILGMIVPKKAPKL
jgi:hypothetical protein